jgi:hypothetical protein
VWASPSSAPGNDAWKFSDAIDLATGARRTGHRWDTGVVAHPGGGLVGTLASDQGATLGLFALADEDGVAAPMRVLRRALILNADGYQTPVFSPDGRFLAIRGSAYGNTLDVFGFPSLQLVLHTTLGDPNPGFPYPPEWLEQQRSWSVANIAFSRRSGALLVGTPRGTVVEVDLDGHRTVEHDVLGGDPVSALAVLATGDVIVASRAGELVMLSDTGDRGAAGSAPDPVTAFLATTTAIADDADLEKDLVLTNGTKTWDPQELQAVTTAAPTDPSWLQLQAVMNAERTRKPEAR